VQVAPRGKYFSDEDSGNEERSSCLWLAIMGITRTDEYAPKESHAVRARDIWGRLRQLAQSRYLRHAHSRSFERQLALKLPIF
jgi:hypothetical protein